MSRSGAWERLMQQHHQAVDDFFADVDETPAGDLDAVLDQAALEAAQRLDPGAGASPWLDVRVAGPQVGAGALSVKIVEDLLTPLQSEIDAALPGGSKELASLELVGVGTGSAILHLLPTIAADNVDDDSKLPGVSSAVDAAIRKVLDVHDAVERRAPADEIAALGQGELMTKLHRLVGVMESHDLTLTMMWRSPSVARRSSRLSREGRSYVGRLFEAELETSRTIVSGYVFEQSLRGTVKLKVDPKKKRSRSYEISISREQLEQSDLHLNQFVRVLVEERRYVNRLGQKSDSSFSFIQIVAHDHLFADESMNE